jgi:hypothetical protein
VGGGIESIGGTVTISGSSFSHNQAIGGAGGAGGPGSVGFGGGLEVLHCSLTLSDSTFDHNAAIGGAGGSGAVGGNAVGGGVAIDRGSTATITNIIVTQNQALGGAGANGGNAWAGGLAVGGFSTFGISDSTSVNLTGSSITHNEVEGGDGGAAGNGGDDAAPGRRPGLQGRRSYGTGSRSGAVASVAGVPQSARRATGGQRQEVGHVKTDFISFFSHAVRKTAGQIRIDVQSPAGARLGTGCEPEADRATVLGLAPAQHGGL